MARNSSDSPEDALIGTTIKLYSARENSDGPLDVTTIKSNVSCSVSSSIKGVSNEYLEI